jgi:hypothetical protein
VANGAAAAEHRNGVTVMGIMIQRDWRYCVKCFGLWFNGNPTNGVCPAGGAHDQGGVSGDYGLIGDSDRNLAD